MKEPDRQIRNAAMVLQCYPTVRRKFAAVVTDLEGHGLRPRIQCAWRSPADQLKAFKGGFSRVKYGYHCATSRDGHPEALAIDVLDDDHPCEEGAEFLRLLGRSARAHGLDRPFPDWDACHLQIVGLSIKQVQAGRRPA